jgi:hypothetical protein
MDWHAMVLKSMRLIHVTVTTCLGGMGIMALLASFRIPDCGLSAIMALSCATIMALATPKPSNHGKSGPTLPRLISKLRETMGGLRPRF